STSDVSSNESIAAIIAGGTVTGKTFVLTNSATADSIITTNGNDTVTGATGTVVNGDLIMDSSSTDNDIANLVVTGAYTPSNITKIENINLDWDAYGTATYNMAAVTGAKNVTLTSSKVAFLGSATVTNVSGVTLTASNGMVGTLTASGFKTGTVEGTKSTALVIDGSTSNSENISITVNAGTAATSVSVGATNGFKSTTVNAGTAPTVTVKDAGNTTDTTALTVNANATITNTGSSGALTLTASDTNNITLNAIGANLTVMGTGAVVINSTGLDGETINNSKSAGTLTIKTTTTGALDLSKVQATSIEQSGVKTAGDTVANGANLKYTGGGVVGITVGGSSVTDAVSVEFTAATLTSLTDTGVETLNVKASAPAISGADLTITSLVTKGHTVKMTGTNDLAVTNIGLAGETNGKLDASGLTGEVTVGIDTTGDSENFSVTGGTGKLTLTTANITGEQVAIGNSADDTVTANATNTGTMTAILADGKNTVSATALTTGTLVVTSGIDTVTSGVALTTGVINLSLGDGANVINLDDGAGAGTRVVTTGAGDDILSFTGSVDDTNDVLTWTAGTGTDTLLLATESADLSPSTKVTLSGVEVIMVKAATTAEASWVSIEATFAASVLSGNTLTIKADAYDAGKPTDVMVKGIATTATINLSAVTIDQSLTSAITAVGIDASANTTTAVTITGTAAADLITGGAKADVIVAGNGADTIVGTAGNDSIDLTETLVNSAIDTTQLLATGTLNGVDTITGFTIAKDIFSLDIAGTTINTAAGAAAVYDTISVTLLAAAGTFTIGTGAGGKTTATADVLELTTTLSSFGNLSHSSDGTELLKALGTTATTAATDLTVAATTNNFYLIAYQDSKAYIYNVTEGADVDALAVAADITLVGVVNNVVAGALTASEF
ncbi:MAG: hypothetical protein JZU70_09915, partial [Chlorobium sp.]|nr:hypothetical protein [Chlorobium sp.]